MAKYFAAHYGSLSNLGQLKSMGFHEAGLVFQWTGSNNNTNAGMASAIHSAGIPVATINIFNDGQYDPCQPGAAGASYAGYFSALAGAGWNCIAGESVFGSVVQAVMNYTPFIWYSGGAGSQLVYGYGAPWNHPSSGGKGHWDYIETYAYPADHSPASNFVSVCNDARSHGSGHVGALIGDWNQGWGLGQYTSMIDAAGCDTICFWGGYTADSSSCVGLAQQLIGHYGAAQGAAPASGGGGGGAAAAAPAKHPVVKCPCRHLWIGFRGVNGSSTSQHIEFKVQLIGTAGWVDDNEKWIANKPYTGKLQLWCRSDQSVLSTTKTVMSGEAAAKAGYSTSPGEETGSGASQICTTADGVWSNLGSDDEYHTFTLVKKTTGKKTWKMMDFYPDKNGKFAIYIGSDTAETRVYNVCFADKGTSPAYQVVMV